MSHIFFFWLVWIIKMIFHTLRPLLGWQVRHFTNPHFLQISIWCAFLFITLNPLFPPPPPHLLPWRVCFVFCYKGCHKRHSLIYLYGLSVFNRTHSPESVSCYLYLNFIIFLLNYGTVVLPYFQCLFVYFNTLWYSKLPYVGTGILLKVSYKLGSYTDIYMLKRFLCVLSSAYFHIITKLLSHPKHVKFKIS